MLIKALLLCQPRSPGAWAARGAPRPPRWHQHRQAEHPSGSTQPSSPAKPAPVRAQCIPSWYLGRPCIAPHG